jgi:hypothetical protein
MVDIGLISAEWAKEWRLLITHLNVKAFVEDIERWKETLSKGLPLIEPHSNFKMLVDLYGYEAQPLRCIKLCAQ